jgi:DNA modification methylase
VSAEKKPRRGPARRLNDLDAKEWVRLTRSWFTCDGRPRSVTPEVAMHPASFPPEVPERFIRFFTRAGETVLDPFLGSGGTLLACATTGRRGIGVELSQKYCAAARTRLQRLSPPLPLAGEALEQTILCADAAALAQLDLPPVDYCFTSPPYWDMLRHSRGDADSAHKDRAQEGLDVVYSQDPRDLGNIADYEAYLDALAGAFEQVDRVLRSGRYVTVVAQNIRTPGGEMAPLAWDLAARLRRLWRLRQETLWCQNNKRLGCWGYPTTFVSNVHHHYCLTFQKDR